ncbi:MAG: tetratricopeptide repeat protein [Myxococcales bacterium]|nr:tetratricopeptide repeat protein [Myxococcales bacterium]
MALRPYLLAILLAFTASACKSEPEVDPAEVAAKRKRDLDNARIRLRDGKVADAKILYQNVLDGEPNNPDALYGMGRVMYEESNYDKARELLEKAIAGKGDDAEFHAALGAVHVSQKNPAGAAAAYGEAFKLDKSNGDYGLKQGENLNKSKKFAEAEAVLREVAEVDRKARFVLTELGDALREQGNLDEALNTYMKAQIENPDDKMAHAGAAFVYEAKGDNKHALDEWSTYIRMDCCSEFSETVARKKMLELEPAAAGG